MILHAYHFSLEEVMPNWNEILKECDSQKALYDNVRRKYLKILQEKTKRNIIAYYSGWLQKLDVNSIDFSITDDDKNGFMTVLKNIPDRKLGLDLIIHTPGGIIGAAESIVDYLDKMFNGNIRVFIPQIAMSAGTMIALSAKEIYMGKQSNIGPIDPQIPIYNCYMSAFDIINEAEKAKKEILNNPDLAKFWSPILSKISIGTIENCFLAIERVKEFARKYLKNNMFAGEKDVQEKIEHIVSQLTDHTISKDHNRHISAEEANRDYRLKIINIETDNNLQDNLLSVHHAYTITFQNTTALKIIENHVGDAYVRASNPVMLPILAPQK